VRHPRGDALSRCLGAAAAALFVTASVQAQPRATSNVIVEAYRSAADRIITAALADSAAWQKLALFTDRFGPRIAGSAALERAIDWILAEMKAEGFENVRSEQVMVPNWVRGRESAELIEPRRAALPTLGLGGSIGTPSGGITAPVLVVKSYDDLKAKAGEAQGKIVLFDVPFTDYNQTVPYRRYGAVAAARAGAVASMIRSVGPFGLRSPHTGEMYYDSTARPIPHFAITIEDAAMLHRMQDRGERIVVRVEMEAETRPNVQSRNIIAELIGREKPDEIVLIGAHTDSWDVGTGAMDNAGAVIAAWEAVRLLLHLRLTPRRTIRLVGWTNEEHGNSGGLAYRDAHRVELENHIVAMESDVGTFRPTAVGFSGPPGARAVIREIVPLLRGIGADSLASRGGGVDVAPLTRYGVPTMSPHVDGSRYWWYHHTEADTVDKLDPRDLALNVALMAVMAYVIADLQDRLPRQ